MRARIPAATLLALTAPATPALAQQQLLQSDDGTFEQAWSLTAPNAGSGDWVGVAYAPPFEFPFRLVSATMFFLDEWCCPASTCNLSCSDSGIADWDRMIIAHENLVVDPAGLTPDIGSPVAEQSSVAMSGPGVSARSAPWTAFPSTWSLPANTIFDHPGRVFFAVKYFEGDQWMNFLVDQNSANDGNSIHTSDNFATRASIWAFGNVGMRVVVAPIVSLKLAPESPLGSFQLAGATNVPMLSFRVSAGESATNLTRVRLTASGSGHDASGIDQVRLVVDLDGDGVPDGGEPTIASGRFALNNGVLDLTFSRTIAAGNAEKWLVVYDFNATPTGGQTFSVRVAAGTDVTTNLGAPYLSGAIASSEVTIAGRLSASLGPNTMPTQIVRPSQQNLATLQVRLRAENEAFRVFRVNLSADGSLQDVTGLASVELHQDLDGSGTLTGGDRLLAQGSFPRNNGTLSLTFPAITIAANATTDLIAVVDLTATAAGGEDFRTIVALPTDIGAEGVVSGLIPPTGARVLTGLPVIGNLATVGGDLTIAAGPASPGAGTAQPSATDVPMLQLALTAAAETVELGSISFEASGVGHEVTDVARARLWVDANGNGVVDGGDRAIGSPATFAADNGRITFGFGAESVPQAATRLWLLTYDFTSAPTGGETFRATLAAADAVAASGQASGAPITPTGSFPIAGGLRTLLGGFSVTLAPENPPPTRVQPGQSNVVVLALRLAAQGETFEVSRLQITAAGSLPDATGIRQARVLRDLGTPGVADPSDVVLGTTTFPTDDGRAVFNFGSPIPLAGGAAETWLVVYDLAANQTPGHTFRAQIQLTSDLTVRGALAGPTTAAGLPLAGEIHSIGGSLLVGPGPSNPLGGTISPSAAGVVMAQVRLSATQEPITITSVTFTADGSGNEAADVSNVRLAVDTNRDGLFDPVGDLTLGTGSTYAQNDGRIAFTFPGRTIVGGATEDWIVVHDFAASPRAGDTFRVRLALDTDVVASAPSGPLPRVGGAPVEGGLRTVLGGLAITPGPANPGPHVAARGATRVPLVQLRLSGNQESFEVRRIAFHALGSVDDVTDLAGLELFADVDEDGQVSGGDTRIVGPVAYLGDDGVLDLAGLSIAVPSQGTTTLLLVTDLADDAVSGRALQVRVPGPADVEAVGLGGRPVAPTGLPISSSPLTIGGTIVLTLGPAPPLSRIVRQAQRGVEALQVSLTADFEAATLTRLTLHAGGTFDDAAAIDEVQLFHDANANGVVDGGERLLSTGRFAANDGAIDLALSETIQPGLPLVLLARVDVDAPAGGETFRLAVDPLADLTVTSASGAVTPAGAVVEGALLTAGGGFRVDLSPSTPQGELVNQASPNVAVAAFRLSAINEPCTVERLTVSTAGSIDDARDVAAVRLYHDVSGNGALDFADVELGRSGPFPIDDGAVAFVGLGRAIGAGATEDWLVVYDLAGSASNLETFRARIATVDDVEVACRFSGPVRAEGVPIEGEIFTIQEDGALLVSLGPETAPSAFLPRGTVRAAALQLRAAARVRDLVLRRVVLTASVTGGSTAGTVESVDLFRDTNQDGRLDRADRLIAGPVRPDASGRLVFPTNLTIFEDEPMYLLAAVNVALGAAPGATITLTVPDVREIEAQSSLGPVETFGNPIAGNPMTIAGDLNVSLSKSSTVVMVHNDDEALEALDLTFLAPSEPFVLEAITISAEGSMEPSKDIEAVRLLRDDGDGVPSAGDTPIGPARTFPEGAQRLVLAGLGEAIPVGTPVRLLVVLDLAGVAPVDRALTVSVAANVDVLARGAQVGATSPIGAPVVGPTFVVGRSLTLAKGPAPLADRVVGAAAEDVAALQLVIAAFNEDVTVTRMTLHASGSLVDDVDITSLRLVLDENQNGRYDPADAELGARARPAADDGSVSFSPLAERIAKNTTRTVLVVADFAGTGEAGRTVALHLTKNADVTAFGSLSGAVAVGGAPIDGDPVALVGGLNVRLGQANPPAAGVVTGKKAAALQLELFTQGEAVNIEQLSLRVDGSADDPADLDRVRLYRDADGDGAVGDGEVVLAEAEPDGNDALLVFSNLDLKILAGKSARVLAELALAEGATPGGTARLSLESNDHVRATGELSGPVTTVGAPIRGNAFSIVRAVVTNPGQPVPEEGCSCRAANGGPPGRPWLLALLVGLGVAFRRRFRTNP